MDESNQKDKIRLLVGAIEDRARQKDISLKLRK